MITALAAAEAASLAAVDRRKNAEAAKADATQQVTVAMEAREAGDAAMAEYKSAQVSCRCFDAVGSPELFAELDGQTQAGDSAKHGPILELLPPCAEHAEPLLMQFDLSEAIEKTEQTDHAVVLVLRQSESTAPWLPLQDDEHVSVDAKVHPFPLSFSLFLALFSLFFAQFYLRHSVG